MGTWERGIFAARPFAPLEHVTLLVEPKKVVGRIVGCDAQVHGRRGGCLRQGMSDLREECEEKGDRVDWVQHCECESWFMKAVVEVAGLYNGWVTEKKPETCQHLYVKSMGQTYAVQIVLAVVRWYSVLCGIYFVAMQNGRSR